MPDDVDLGSRFLRWERRGPVAWVTIDRPERRNALTSNMYFGIRRAVDRVNQSRSLHALVITGTGDVFAPGGEMGGQHDDGAIDYGELLGTGTVPFDAIRDSRKPVIAAVNGLCMGGGLLITMLSDVAIASDRAVFGAPELLRGVADAYHAAILPEHVGIAIARDMLFTGRRLSATEAEQHGLVARVVPHEQLMTATEEVVQRVLQSAPRARVALKRLINARYGVIDKVTFDESVNGEEVVEGFLAFVEKRTPAWVPEEFREGVVDLGLAGAAAVVSGGSKGMGRATAVCLASEGARVAVLARGQRALDETVADLGRVGSPDAVAISTDLTDREQVDAAFAQLTERWGECNVLVNAAGPVEVGIRRFEDLDDAEWLATFDIGTLSAARCVRAALPLLRAAAWARIVNVSAHSTKRQSAELVAYTASKAALTSLTKNLSLSLAPHNILVNTVSPGSFLSEGMRGYLRSLPPERGIDPESLEDAMRVIAEDFGHPAHLPRAGDPNEIGPVITFLASRVNSYMTGANVNVDGGSDFA